jgi:hypothetical protein
MLSVNPGIFTPLLHHDETQLSGPTIHPRINLRLRSPVRLAAGVTVGKEAADKSERRTHCLSSPPVMRKMYHFHSCDGCEQREKGGQQDQTLNYDAWNTAAKATLQRLGGLPVHGVMVHPRTELRLHSRVQRGRYRD